MLVGAGDVLVNERRRLQDNAALGARKPAGLLSREINGRDSKGRAAWQALCQLWSFKNKGQGRKRGTRNLDVGFNGKLYAIIWDINYVINYYFAQSQLFSRLITG